MPPAIVLVPGGIGDFCSGRSSLDVRAFKNITRDAESGTPFRLSIGRTLLGMISQTHSNFKQHDRWARVFTTWRGAEHTLTFAISRSVY